MSIRETEEKMDSLKKELDSLKPFKKEDEERLWKKFRLDFNWNSNHLEGNTLTYSQTELLLIFDKTSEGHDLREFEEMKAHDVALKMIVELASDKERDLSETFIRQLNEIILVRPFWNDAITPEGKRTKREITPGEYKKQPNSVLLKNGEMFHYPSPEETPALMGDLMKFYKENSISTEVHPTWLAAMMHYKFVRIHPFDDGNGRVTRLIMNFILMKNGYPPAIIKSTKKDKDEYLYALNQADVGNDEYFQNYIYEQIIRSLEISIKAAKGESIDEPDDLDKEIDLLKRHAKRGNKISVEKSRDAIQNVYRSSLQNLFVEIERQLSTFNELFFKMKITYTVSQPVQTSKLGSFGEKLSYVEDQIFFDVDNIERFGEAPPAHGGELYVNQKRVFDYPIIDNIRVTFAWKKYHEKGVNAFDVYQDVEVYFSDTKYIIGGINGQNIIKQKLYDETLSNDEVVEISSAIKRQVVRKINDGLKRTDE